MVGVYRVSQELKASKHLELRRHLVYALGDKLVAKKFARPLHQPCHLLARQRHRDRNEHVKQLERPLGPAKYKKGPRPYYALARQQAGRPLV